MNLPKSPFFVIESFLSPMQCDEIVDAMNIVEPDTGPDGDPIKSTRHLPHYESVVYTKLTEQADAIRAHYGFEWKGTEEMSFEFFPEGCIDGLDPICSNSVYVKRKWIRNSDRDFSGVLFLSDYNDGSTEAFDPDFEVYGGKLQFPQHGFSFNAKRGTLVLFPAGPHFIHSFSRLLAGDLAVVRFHIAAKMPWLYQPTNFPGDYKQWFKLQ